jgi:hypothetical protein
MSPPKKTLKKRGAKPASKQSCGAPWYHRKHPTSELKKCAKTSTCKKVGKLRGLRCVKKKTRKARPTGVSGRTRSRAVKKR